MLWVNGNELPPSEQKRALAAFPYRFTKDHVPDWARKTRVDGTSYPVQFANDADWLANTRFAVTKSGRLDERATYCESSPTWPNGKPSFPGERT